MNIEISLKSLQNFGISPDEFVYLRLLQVKRYDYLKKLKLEVNLEYLQTKGYLKVGEELEDHVVREAFINPKAVPFDTMWSELLSHFPLKVYVNGSVRVLRAKDPSALSNIESKKKYKKYLKEDSNRHQAVVSGLITELDIRTKGNQLGYMQMLSTWINQRTWEKYQDLQEINSNERRTTRQL
jgi:hypothetical protein